MKSILLFSLLCVTSCIQKGVGIPVRIKSTLCDYLIDTENGTVCGLKIGATEAEFSNHFGIANIARTAQTGENSPYAFCYRLKDEDELTFCFDGNAIWYRTYSNSKFIVTSRGVKVGDSPEIPIERYGEPTLRHPHENGCCETYEYTLPNKTQFTFVEKGGKVGTISLNKFLE